MTGPAERARTAGGVLAVIRVSSIPVFFTAERIVEHPNQNSAPFDVLIVLAAVYAVAALAGELCGRPLARPRVLAAVDLLGIALLVATSGGPFSQLRYAFFLLPVGTALLLGPGPTAVVSVVSVALYGVIAWTFPEPQLEREDWAGFEVTQALFLTWMGLAATLLAGLLARRAREVERLSASRGRLVGQALDAEERARRRLAEALHDEALQNVLAVRQLLGSARAEDRDLLVEGLDRGIRQIREAVFNLHPYLLEQAGLEAALRAVAEEAGRRAGFRATVRVERDAAGLHDQLLFALAREAIANAAKHANPSTVTVDLTREPDAVVLRVGDDGSGFDPVAARAAPLRGHIGLASSAERAEAIGGSFTVLAGARGRGTQVTARLPAPAWAGPGASDQPAAHRSHDARSSGPSAERRYPASTRDGKIVITERGSIPQAGSRQDGAS